MFLRPCPPHKACFRRRPVSPEQSNAGLQEEACVPRTENALLHLGCTVDAFPSLEIPVSLMPGIDDQHKGFRSSKGFWWSTESSSSRGLTLAYADYGREARTEGRKNTHGPLPTPREDVEAPREPPRHKGGRQVLSWVEEDSNLVGSLILNIYPKYKTGIHCATLDHQWSM